MGARRSLIHVGAANFSHVISHHEGVKSFLLCFAQIEWAIPKTTTSFLILNEGNLRPLLKIIVAISLLQKVVSTLVVNFDVRHAKFVLDMMAMLLEELKNVTEDSWNDASFFPVIAAAHGKSLSTSGLAIRKDGPIVPFKAVVDDGFCQMLENLLLSAFFLKNMAEPVLVLFFRGWEFGPVGLKDDGAVVVDQNG